jgi:hypothetical protein
MIQGFKKKERLKIILLQRQTDVRAPLLYEKPLLIYKSNESKIQNFVPTAQEKDRADRVSIDNTDHRFLFSHHPLDDNTIDCIDNNIISRSLDIAKTKTTTTTLFV